MSDPDPFKQTTDQLIASLIFKTVIPFVETALIANQPWLGSWLCKPILDFFLKQISAEIFKVLSQYVAFEMFDWKTSAEQSQYERAEAILRQAHLSGDPNALAQAQNNFCASLASLIHFDPPSA